MPDFDTREYLAEYIWNHRDLDLAGFTRDGYRTMYVKAWTDHAERQLIAKAENAGFDVSEMADADRVVLEAPARTSKKARGGGNRL